jgi:hypothetical protein
VGLTGNIEVENSPKNRVDQCESVSKYFNRIGRVDQCESVSKKSCPFVFIQIDLSTPLRSAQDDS